MSYLHQVVVYYIGKVICRIAIALDKHLIIKYAIVKHNFPMHEVSPLAHTVGNEHADD